MLAVICAFFVVAVASFGFAAVKANRRQRRRGRHDSHNHRMYLKSLRHRYVVGWLFGHHKRHRLEYHPQHAAIESGAGLDGVRE